jgi:TrmH family RNA methyltransferase
MPHMRKPAYKSSRPESHSNSRQPQLVTGKDNRWLARFRAALAGRAPVSEQCLGIEGPRLIVEALRSSVPIDAILVSESGRKHLATISAQFGSTTELLATTDRMFESIAATETPQGIAALVRPKRASFDELLRGEKPALVVVLVGVQDPGNVGTILRAAEALGASGVAACQVDSLGTAHLFSPKVVRASAGSVFRLPVAEGLSISILQAQFKTSGVRMIAATSAPEVGDAVAPWQADLRGPVALLIGNEGSGLPDALERAADERIRIPLAAAAGMIGGHVESLNAAMAATVLLYEAARQRAGLTDERALGQAGSPA